MKGFVYVLSNVSMPGLIKVGMTTKVPEGRAKELSSATASPTPFVIEYYAMFDDMEKAERLAHQKLNHYHHGKEFFKATPSQAVQVIESLGLPFTRLHLTATVNIQTKFSKSDKETLRRLHCRDGDERCSNCLFGSIRNEYFISCKKMEWHYPNDDARCKFWQHI